MRRDQDALGRVLVDQVSLAGGGAADRVLPFRYHDARFIGFDRTGLDDIVRRIEEDPA